MLILTVLLSGSVLAITRQPTSVKIKDLVATFIDKFYLSLLCLLQTENKALTWRAAAAPHAVKLSCSLGKTYFETLSY